MAATGLTWHLRKALDGLRTEPMGQLDRAERELPLLRRSSGRSNRRRRVLAKENGSAHSTAEHLTVTGNAAVMWTQAAASLRHPRPRHFGFTAECRGRRHPRGKSDATPFFFTAQLRHIGLSGRSGIRVGPRT